jgi:hypothetical protein
MSRREIITRSQRPVIGAAPGGASRGRRSEFAARAAGPAAKAPAEPAAAAPSCSRPAGLTVARLRRGGRRLPSSGQCSRTGVSLPEQKGVHSGERLGAGAPAGRPSATADAWRHERADVRRRSRARSDSARTQPQRSRGAATRAIPASGGLALGRLNRRRPYGAVCATGSEQRAQAVTAALLLA